MPAQLYVSETIVEPLARFAKERGANIDRRLSALRIGRTASQHADPQILAAKVVNLFEDLAGELSDPAFGVHYAQEFPVGGSGALGFIVTQAKDLRTAVAALARYTRIVMPGIVVEVHPIEGGCELVWHYPLTLPVPNIQFNSFVAAVVVLRLRLGLSGNWSPRLVELAHRDPGAADAYRSVFGPHVRFACPLNRICFRDANLDRPYASANPRLYKVVTQLGELLLSAQKATGDFRTEVANAIVDKLGSSPTLTSVAQTLGMGERTVQRRLAAKGATFEVVLNETRRHVAERLLSETDLPLTDIALMLSFSELSAFTRAAKKWFGVSPRQFRGALKRPDKP